MKDKHILLHIAVALLLISCGNDDFLYQDASRIYLGSANTQGAAADTALISFKLYDSSLDKLDIQVSAHIRGHVSKEDRVFNVVADLSQSNVTAQDFTIGDLVIPAGSYHGTVPISLNRQVAGLNLNSENAYLTIRVVPNENFGLPEEQNSSYKILWCDYLSRPATWNIIQSYVGPFTQARYKFIIDVTGLTEFPGLNGNFNQLNSFQSQLKRALLDYNADPSNAGRPEGWPYLNDDGITPLQIGSGLSI